MKKAKKAAGKKSAKRVSTRGLSKSVALFSEAHVAARRISASTIYDLWVCVLGRPIKDLDDPPSDYNITSVIAYADFLNKTSQFEPYGLDLQQSDMVNVVTMGDLGGEIVGNFQNNGWTVTPD